MKRSEDVGVVARKRKGDEGHVRQGGSEEVDGRIVPCPRKLIRTISAFLELIRRIESNFVVAGINNFERIEFLVCLGFLCCVLWPVFTRGDTEQGHSTAQGHTAESCKNLFF